MRVNSLPQQILAKLLMFDDFARACEQAADRAESELAKTREILSGRGVRTGDNKRDQANFKQAQTDFDSIYKRAQEARKQANAERACASAVKAWVSGLAEGTEVALVEPVVPGNGIDLVQVRSKITGLRAAIAKIRNAPLPAADIETRVRDYVGELARAARPLVSGFQAGGTLDVKWPVAATANRQNGFGFDNMQGNVLLMAALLHPQVLTDYLLAQIDAMSNELMPVQERPGKLAELAAELERWERLAAMLTDEAIADGVMDIGHDPQSATWITLGVAAVMDAGARERAA